MARTYRQLDLDQRRTLFRLLEARTPVGEIAERLGRHPSTIHRELGRDRFRDGDRGFCGYFPLNAQDLARRRRQRRRKLVMNDGLRAHVTERLEAGWSPQQIAGRLKREPTGGASVCHETIYRHVYGPEGRRDGLYRHLPEARRRRGSRHGRRPRSASIPRERRIENRPAEVGTRETFGHREADLLIFRKEHGKANVTSLVERKSRFTFLLPNEDERSTAVIAGIAGALRGSPEDARRTVTFDRGSEFAGYAALDRDLAVKAYFCDPHSPWQKGAVENLNGRARRLLPREAAPEALTRDAPRRLADRLNDTPAALPRLPDAQRSLPAAPGGPDRPALTSPGTCRTSRRNRLQLRSRPTRSGTTPSPIGGVGSRPLNAARSRRPLRPISAPAPAACAGRGSHRIAPPADACRPARRGLPLRAPPAAATGNRGRDASHRAPRRRIHALL